MSSKLIYGEEDRLLPWALERIGLDQFRSDAYTIGLERNGEIVAVVIYDNFSECNANMHIASDGTGLWMTKELLLTAFAYPFVQLGLKRLTSLIAAKNEKSLKLNDNIGFKREGFHPQSMKNDDMVSLGLLRSDCRFIPKEHRK